MTRDDIISMAREAGFETGTAICEVVVRHSNGSWVGINAELIEFAALVAAAEREECAALCERFALRDMHPAECAGAIRKMGDT